MTPQKQEVGFYKSLGTSEVYSPIALGTQRRAASPAIALRLLAFSQYRLDLLLEPLSGGLRRHGAFQGDSADSL
jgi:hypothetical protein